MNYMRYMKAVDNISPEALATYSDMNKHYKYVGDSYVFGHIPGEVYDRDEWEDGFVSDELDVGSKQIKLHIVNHDDIDDHYALYNVPRSGQLVGLTVIIIVVTI